MSRDGREPQSGADIIRDSDRHACVYAVMISS
jgi:hypothetical protein